MQKSFYYVKSLEEDFATKTITGKKKTVCQTIDQIIKSKIIKPNTNSFGRKKRLACTLLHKNYLKTYRPQGLIFQTNKKPDYYFPFDLAVLRASNNIVTHYYKIKNNLHIYYNQELIKGFEKFIFKDFSKMLKKISSPKSAAKKVNEFRKKAEFDTLPNSKLRLVQYNEAVFQSIVKIKPIGIFGRTKKARQVAQKVNLHCYSSAKEFYKTIFDE
ncbi:MAG: hypothetical protein WCI04_05310 [archaeon]